MKVFNKICYGFALFCWGTLCILAATGVITIEPADYCIATGVLTLTYLERLITGD